MEVAVLAGDALFLRVGMVIVLGVILGIVDVALRIVAPLVECAGAAQDLPDDVVAGLGQHTLAVQHFTRRLRHVLQLAA